MTLNHQFDGPPDGQKAAIFLDRDGTIIEDRGHLKNPEEVVLLPGAIEALRRLGRRYLLFVISNQSGVARGEITLDDVYRVNAHLEDMLLQNGISIRAWYVCPHLRSENCHCIKPNPYFLLKASREFGISLPDSFSIGDHPHDVHAGVNAGGRGLFVLTGHGSRHSHELPPGAPIFEGIGDAAAWILGERQKKE